MLTLTPLMPEHETTARALVDASLAGTRYHARTVEQLDAALRFEDPEFLAVLAMNEQRNDAVALALFGAVAGAARCTKLHALLGGDDDALDVLASAVVQVCEDSGERLAVCELPEDAIFATAASALGAAGFVEEGRVYDYVADGVALRLLVWRA